MIELATNLDKIQPWVRVGLYQVAFEATTHLGCVAKVISGNLGKNDEHHRAHTVLQKSVLLMERLLGMSGGHFRYRWDITGPYSIDLANSVDQLRVLCRLGHKIPDDVSDEETHAIQRVAERVDRVTGSHPEGLPEHEWMELLASIVFLLSDEPGEWISPDKDHVCRMIRRNGGKFSNEQIVGAINVLNSLFSCS